MLTRTKETKQRSGKEKNQCLVPWSHFLLFPFTSIISQSNVLSDGSFNFFFHTVLHPLQQQLLIYMVQEVTAAGQHSILLLSLLTTLCTTSLCFFYWSSISFFFFWTFPFLTPFFISAKAQKPTWFDTFGYPPLSSLFALPLNQFSTYSHHTFSLPQLLLLRCHFPILLI